MDSKNTVDIFISLWRLWSFYHFCYKRFQCISWACTATFGILWRRQQQNGGVFLHLEVQLKSRLLQRLTVDLSIRDLSPKNSSTLNNFLIRPFQIHDLDTLRLSLIKAETGDYLKQTKSSISSSVQISSFSGTAVNKSVTNQVSML
jgi:hypothetical protein